MKWMRLEYQNAKGAARILSYSYEVSSLVQATKILASLPHIA
jgi:hypothetical protein